MTSTVKHIWYYLFGQLYSGLCNSFVICSPVVAPVVHLGWRLECECAVRQRGVGTQAGGSTARSTVAVVGEIPNRPFLGCVVVTRPAHEEKVADSPAGPCPSFGVRMLRVKRRSYSLLDCHWQITPSCCHRQITSSNTELAVHFDVTSCPLILMLTSLSWHCCCLSWCRLEWFLWLCLLLDADVEWFSAKPKPSQSVNWGRRLARSASRRPPVC